jgi:very-short-patch-repair endonuclease
MSDAHVKFLRHHQTRAEHRLWLQLRNKRVANRRFRRQVGLDRYVVDFVCFSLRLIIEVDGPSHELTPGQDAVRTRRLAAQGYRVIRFSNEQVMRELDSVVETIRAVIAEMAANHGDDRLSGALPRADPAP